MSNRTRSMAAWPAKGESLGTRDHAAAAASGRPRACSQAPSRNVASPSPGQRAADSASNRRAAAGEPEAIRALAASRLARERQESMTRAGFPRGQRQGDAQGHDDGMPTHSILPMRAGQAFLRGVSDPPADVQP